MLTPLPLRNTASNTWTYSRSSGIFDFPLNQNFIRAQHPDAPVDELEKLATERVVSKQKKSRAFYRIQATRKMIGGGDITQKKLKKKASEMVEPLIKKENMAVVE